jgi:hypothetical protein
MDTHLPRRPALRRTVATLATVTALIAAAPADAEQSDSVTANFDALTTTGDWHSGQALGTFSMTGALGDAGTVRIAYRLFGRHIHATATLIGAKGILTIDLRAAMALVLNDHQSAVGRWRTCGGTGPYRRLATEIGRLSLMSSRPRRAACHGRCTVRTSAVSIEAQHCGAPAPSRHVMLTAERDAWRRAHVGSAALKHLQRPSGDALSASLRARRRKAVTSDRPRAVTSDRPRLGARDGVSRSRRRRS